MEVFPEGEILPSLYGDERSQRLNSNVFRAGQRGGDSQMILLAKL